MDHARNTLTHKSQRGAVLVEFALVALTLSLLLAATIEFGRLLFYAQALQDVARVAARELSVTPLPADPTFDEALLNCDRVQMRIFNPSFLVIDLDTFPTDAALDAHFAQLPVVNRALRPLMIIDQPDPEGPRYLRYPGALLTEPTPPLCPTTLPISGYTVGIPRVDAHDPETGAETITWVPVIEELAPGHFSAACAGPPCGIVALRINYPYQAGAITAHVPNPAGPAEPTLGNPIQADDEGVVETNAPPGETLPVDPQAPFPNYPIYSGPYGLGRQLAYGGLTVRPYRKLLSAQAIYRREVIGD